MADDNLPKKPEPWRATWGDLMDESKQRSEAPRDQPARAKHPKTRSSQKVVPQAEIRELIEKKEGLFRPVRRRIRKSRYDHSEVENALEWLDSELTKLLAETLILGIGRGAGARQLLDEQSEGAA